MLRFFTETGQLADYPDMAESKARGVAYSSTTHDLPLLSLAGASWSLSGVLNADVYAAVQGRPHSRKEDEARVMLRDAGVSIDAIRSANTVLSPDETLSVLRFVQGALDPANQTQLRGSAIYHRFINKHTSIDTSLSEAEEARYAATREGLDDIDDLNRLAAKVLEAFPADYIEAHPYGPEVGQGESPVDAA